MLLFYIWVYTFFLAIIWWFFIVAKIHSCKFKDFQSEIPKVTKILIILLIILTLLWYLIIFIWVDTKKTYDLTDKLNSSKVEKTWENLKIWEDYY